MKLRDHSLPFAAVMAAALRAPWSHGTGAEKVMWLRSIRIIGLVHLATACLFMAGFVGRAQAEDLDMRFRQLLLDESVVAKSDGVERLYGQYQPSNVRLVEVTEPIERGYVGRIGGPMVIYDAEAGKYRMWYQSITRQPDGSGGRGHLALYAESDNLLTWRKPHLGNVDWRGDGKQNNAVLDGNFHSVTLLPDGERRLVGFTHGHSTDVYLMSDGRRVEETVRLQRGTIPNSTEVRAELGRFNTDAWNAFYDPVTERVLAMSKTYAKLEDSADPTLWRRAVAPGVGKFTADGVSLDYSGQVLGVDVQDEARLLEVPHLAGDSVPSRQFGPLYPFNRYPDRSPSDWPPSSELHDLMPFRYEGLYLGFRNHLYRYPIIVDNRAGREPGTYGEHSSEYFLTWSRDFEDWTRPDHRTPLLPVPEVDSDHFGFMRLRWPSLLRVGDELWLFYGVPVGYGNGPPTPPNGQWLSYATLRVDGWCGYRAGTEGTIETAPFVADGKLHMNVDAAEGGSLEVEVLDEAGQVIPGYDGSACRPITSDAPAAAVSWTGNDWSDLAGQRVRLRFRLNQATLYAFWTREDAELIGIQSPPQPAEERGAD